MHSEFSIAKICSFSFALWECSDAGSRAVWHVSEVDETVLEVESDGHPATGFCAWDADRGHTVVFPDPDTV